MKRLQPVIWSKGVFLSPQHLQLQDRFLENVLQFQLESLSFRPWGFRALQVSQEGLAGGSFGISSASGMMPDGLLFDIPGSDSAPPPKQLAECFEPDQTSVELYLAVPQYRERGLNVASSSREAGARYRAEIELFRDENSGLAEKPVQVARKNFRLLAEGEALDGYTTLRAGRVNRTEAGTFQLDPRFVPPLLDFQGSDYLMAIARRLVEILTARSSAIAGMRRQKNQSLADFTAADIASFWLLYTINTSFPLLRHLFETRGGHPEELYSAMLSLAGALTTFSAVLHPRELPAYNHDDLGGCFTELDEKLRLLLETVVPSNFVALPLKLAQPSIYAASIDNDKYLVNTKMYLAVNAEASQADVVAKTPQLVKVCSASHIEHLVRNALPGVTLTYVPAPPSAIPVKLNYQYFSLSQSGIAWEAIQRARNLAAYVPAELPNPQLELIILLPQAG
ncbi:MAG: type VI secretion system baseplate subunit TssK [Acidobacteriia bacterium]|nr:type VI secretion system baseplate subunit TssK [Terriglobia bacterium]